MMPTLPKMDAFWMPFSATKNFKSRPRLLASAKDMYYFDTQNRKIMDTCAGLWCCNAGHCRDEIVESIQKQAANLDFAPSFHFGHPLAFEFSEKISDFFPDTINSIFLTNSGSEAVDTAIKIVLAYQRLRQKGEKQIIIGRERSYHGVGFGGISVGGIPKNRLWFGSQLLRTDHMPHTALSENVHSRGIPEHGGEDLANALQNIVRLHDASNIAAVIVEPVFGSAGVLPPPKGYLQRLREICDEHDILLIFDEVITSFGRLGAKTAAEYFGVIPDLITFAKGCTSGTVPLGGVGVRDDIRQTFLDSVDKNTIDFFHGYTYSAHPLSVAAGLATLSLYEKEGLMNLGEDMSSYFENALHSLANHPNVIDIRNIGFMGAIECQPRPGAPGQRAIEIMEKCFHEKDLLIRVTGDIIALSPPLIMEKSHIDEIINRIGEALKEVQ